MASPRKEACHSYERAGGRRRCVLHGYTQDALRGTHVANSRSCVRNKQVEVYPWPKAEKRALFGGSQRVDFVSNVPVGRFSGFLQEQQQGNGLRFQWLHAPSLAARFNGSTASSPCTPTRALLQGCQTVLLCADIQNMNKPARVCVPFLAWILSDTHNRHVYTYLTKG